MKDVYKLYFSTLFNCPYSEDAYVMRRNHFFPVNVAIDLLTSSFAVSNTATEIPRISRRSAPLAPWSISDSKRFVDVERLSLSQKHTGRVI